MCCVRGCWRRNRRSLRRRSSAIWSRCSRIRLLGRFRRLRLPRRLLHLYRLLLMCLLVMCLLLMCLLVMCLLVMCLLLMCLLVMCLLVMFLLVMCRLEGCLPTRWRMPCVPRVGRVGSVDVVAPVPRPWAGGWSNALQGGSAPHALGACSLAPPTPKAAPGPTLPKGCATPPGLRPCGAPARKSTHPLPH